jgi:hypothetical protein
MRQFFLIVLFSVSLSYTLFSQKATIQGTVRDAGTGEYLEGATVLQPPTNGTTTDISGSFKLETEPGEVTLVISYIGMKQDTIHLKNKRYFPWRGRQRVANHSCYRKQGWRKDTKNNSVGRCD